MKYGFVYIWYDRKRKMFYIGCHWGTVDDGYICSSNRMRKAYSRRPQDFKRRILKSFVATREQTFEEEHRWFSLIKEEELGIKYYNLRKHKWGHWASDVNSKLTVGQKISLSHKSNPNFGKWNIGKPLSEETKRKISESTSASMKQYYQLNPRTSETSKKISDNSKRLQAEGIIGMRGKKHTPETIDKMKNNNAMNNPEHIEKIKMAKKGIKWLKKDNIKKMAVPGTDKYNDLLHQGFVVL